MSENSRFPIENLSEFKEKLLHWANQFSTFICLDHNSAQGLNQGLEFFVGVDALTYISLNQEPGQFEELKEFQRRTLTTIYGYLAYDLKNEVEQLYSHNPDELDFPITYFFEPRYTFQIRDGYCEINRSTLEALHLLDQIKATEPKPAPQAKLDWQSRIKRGEYIETIHNIQNDIREGTVYELNYCRELYAQPETFHSLQAFHQINRQAKAPFSAYLKIQDKQVMCFSPERFMKHKDGFVQSQPIKGTVPKAPTKAENEILKKQLFNDEKERAENVMIVDLVRNDFARSSKPGTVKVDELFGIYEFENIIQMISTVSGELRGDIHPLDALKNAYPMGSMTGAPKIRAMQLIEQYEKSKRGVYSGAMGYISADLSYDFNVVIRTMLYNETKNYLSLHVGGAITYDAIPEKEWEETEIKANSILKYL